MSTGQLDPRGPRFTATVNALLFVAILVTGNGWVALAVAVTFAIGAYDPRLTPTGLVFRTLIAPRLAPPREREDIAPVRFAQAVGLAFTLAAAAAYFADLDVAGLVAAGFGLAAAFLNAAFGLCLGCEAYLLLRRVRA